MNENFRNSINFHEVKRSVSSLIDPDLVINQCPTDAYFESKKLWQLLSEIFTTLRRRVKIKFSVSRFLYIPERHTYLIS